MKNSIRPLPYILLLAQLFVVQLCLAPLTCYSAELAGVTLPDSTEVAGTPLLLNGIGLREATVFKVDVYVAGLYLEKKTNDPVAILSDKGKKRLTMQFVRDVGVDKIRKGWVDGFTSNLPDVANLQEKISAFNNMMTDISSGQSITLTFADSNVQIEVAGAKKGEIEGEDFQQALLSIWLGASPPNPELKSGLLGG